MSTALRFPRDQRVPLPRPGQPSLTPTVYLIPRASLASVTRDEFPELSISRGFVANPLEFATAFNLNETEHRGSLVAVVDYGNTVATPGAEMSGIKILRTSASVKGGE